MAQHEHRTNRRRGLPSPRPCGVLAFALAALVGGCGQSVRPGRTHHRLYSWNCPSTKDGKAYLVLRHEGEWTNAGKSTRVGLIKFRTQPPPRIIDDQYVWGVPTGGEEYVLFDAMRNHIVIRETGYVRPVELGGDAGGLLAFADRRSGAIEVVRPDGRVAVSAASGYTDVKLAFARPDGTAVLALARADGQLELRDAQGETVNAGPMLTTLDLGLLVTP